jgi:hypothetical protein
MTAPKPTPEAMEVADTVLAEFATEHKYSLRAYVALALTSFAARAVEREREATESIIRAHALSYANKGQTRAERRALECCLLAVCDRSAP